MSSSRVHNLEYCYPRDIRGAAYPRNAGEICRQLHEGLWWHRLTSLFLVMSLLCTLLYFVSPDAGSVAILIFLLTILLKVGVLSSKRVRLNYTMDQNWKNFANARMAPFTYLSMCQRVWEVMSSSNGYDRKYNAGCSVQVSRKDVRIVRKLPFPFESNVNGFAIYLCDVRFIFLPDCVYMIKGSSVMALYYEHLKWSIGFTNFVEETPPGDARVVDVTWQYVNKKGGPDRRFRNNPQLSKCLYGEFNVNFANQRRALLLLSNANMAEGIAEL